ncbi:MAG: MarR family transcriptional regulator [Actinobacteria bacterium]|nr:MarR family transcriptional regulator [Actinomycetota bacterium]MDI6831569.1 MarR family transcriptional regulator [Actinomycetota bacterium]
MSGQEDLDTYARKLLEALMRAFHSFRDERRWRVSEDLSFHQVMLLLFIAERGVVTAGEVARNLCVTQGVITRMADRLLEKGLISRSRDREDRRVVRLSLTPKGRRLAERVEKKRIEDMKAVLSNLSDAERESLLAVFRKIGDHLERVRGGEG